MGVVDGDLVGAPVGGVGDPVVGTVVGAAVVGTSVGAAVVGSLVGAAVAGAAVVGAVVGRTRHSTGFSVVAASALHEHCPAPSSVYTNPSELYIESAICPLLNGN